MSTVGVVGAGSWGTALALVAARSAAAPSVMLWCRRAELANEINRTRKNEAYLPGIALSDRITATADLADLKDADVQMLVTPAQSLREIAAQLAAVQERPSPLVICSKGFEQKTGLFMTEVAAEAAPGHPLAVLSGPSFADEVAKGLPAAITLATEGETGEALLPYFQQAAFRPYLTDDLKGTQIGGAVKNVLAIACGIVDGKGLGENARAALISRGFAEMLRFGVKAGARPETLTGLSGLGDLVLTCSSHKSRNMSLGRALGQGQSLADILGSRRSVTEGVATSGALCALARNIGVDMPIAQAVHLITSGRLTVDDAIEALLNRPLKAEFDADAIGAFPGAADTTTPQT